MYQTLHSLVANEPPAANQERLQGGDTDRVQDPDLWYHRLQGIVVLFYTTARIRNQPPEGSSGIPEVLYDQDLGQCSMHHQEATFLLISFCCSFFFYFIDVTFVPANAL